MNKVVGLQKQWMVKDTSKKSSRIKLTKLERQSADLEHLVELIVGPLMPNYEMAQSLQEGKASLRFTNTCMAKQPLVSVLSTANIATFLINNRKSSNRHGRLWPVLVA